MENGVYDIIKIENDNGKVVLTLSRDDQKYRIFPDEGKFIQEISQAKIIKLKLKICNSEIFLDISK